MAVQTVYLVGGAVRDQLLGRVVTDRDWVVVGSTPAEMQALGFKQVARDFPVFLHPKTHEEYALARTERKKGHGYKGFTVHADASVTLEADLKRRDLTINAMALSNEGRLIDPFNGFADLQAKKLRHVSEAFVEDPVRVLRIARFAARYYSLGFEIAEETFALMKTMVQQSELNHLVPERVWQECYLALGEDKPSVFIRVLRDCGALALVLPELDALFGVPNPAEWHPEIDTGIHMLMVVDAAATYSPERAVRFAALVHDLGKGLTPESQWPSHKGHEESGVQQIKILCQRLGVPHHFKHLAILTSRYHGIVHRVFTEKPETVLTLLENTKAFHPHSLFNDFLLACMADFKGRLNFENKAYPQIEYLKQAQRLLNDIKIEPFLQSGLKGAALGAAIHQHRLDLLSGFSPADTFHT